MPKLILKELSPMQLGRVNTQLNKFYRFADGQVCTMRERLESYDSLEFGTSSGADLDYNRQTFNRLDYSEQRAYMARLEAKKHYFINDHKVPKVVFDALNFHF